MKQFLLSLFTVLILSVIVQPLAATTLQDVALEKGPAWMNLFNWKGDRHAFDLRKLAAAEKLSLRDAAEVQNHYLDQVDDRQDKRPAEEKFLQALKRVKEGKPGHGDGAKYEDVWNQEALDKAKFIVVFDLDDTMLNQYYTCGIKGEKFYDLKMGEKNSNPYMEEGKYDYFVKFVPGWKEAILKIRELGGSVVVFTAKNDRGSHKILNLWKLDEKTALTDVIDGFLTKNHLSQVPSKKDRGQAWPMKDLELVDPTLKKVIIVDDSPSKTYQPLNVRFFHEFNPDVYYAEDTPAEVKKMIENMMPEVVAEVEESLTWMAAHADASFVDAYRPYTLMGRAALDALLGSGQPKEKALELVRTTKGLVTDGF